MSLKETPKKFYRAPDSAFDPSPCRLCHTVGDSDHRKNIFKPQNQVLLKTAELLCGERILQEPDLPHLLCRPCERRLKNTLEFQRLIKDTHRAFKNPTSHKHPSKAMR